MRAVLNVSQAAIVGRKLCPEVGDREVHEPAASLTAVLFSGCDQARAESGVLACGIDGQQSEISPLPTVLDKNASHKGGLFNEQQEFSFREKFADLIGTGAIMVDEEALAPVGVVNDARDRVGVIGRGVPELQERHKIDHNLPEPH